MMKRNSYNIALDADSYKHSHATQYPPGTETVHSYIEPRKGGDFDEIVFFGLTPILDKLAEGVTVANVEKAFSICKAHGVPFNYNGWMKIVTKLGGKLPLEIRAVPEGSVVPAGTGVVFVKNTGGADYAWLTSFVETMLLRVWYPSTVATLSREAKKIILRNLRETGTPEEIGFKLHDFGSRGVSSQESAGLGAAAHLVNFMGTDTMEGLIVAAEHYACEMAGFSIPAAEHSTITSWGKDHEQDAYENMIDQFAGEGKLYAVVSDSYDLFNAVENIWGGTLKDKVIAKGGRLVVRPDSGDPASIVLKTVELLGKTFGFTKNEKGYNVLHPSVRVIQGDGINLQSIEAILFNLKIHGWSADNVAFGMGGGLLQGVNRDTCRWAMKCSAIELDTGEIRDVQKMPKTDPTKASKAGILVTMDSVADGIITYRGDVPMFDGEVRLDSVAFSNGEITTHWIEENTFDKIRARAAKGL